MVIGNADRHKHHIPPARRKPRHDIAQQSQPRRSHPPVQRQPALGKDCLRDALGGGHLHVPRQDPAIQRVAVAAPDEIRPHRPDHPRQGPDPRPFAHRIGNRRPPRHQPGHQHIIHVRPVVHHEHHRSRGVDPAQRRVWPANPHPVQQPAEPARCPDRHPEIQRGREPRHNLARITPRLLEHHRHRQTGLSGPFAHRVHDGAVIDQPRNPVLPLGQLEQIDRPVQPLVQALDGPLDPRPEKPAHRREQEIRRERRHRKGDDQHEQPQRHANNLGHAAILPCQSCVIRYSNSRRFRRR